MGFETEKIDDIALIRIVGRLAFENISDFQNELRGLIQDGSSKFIIDLGQMDFIDSAGLGVFVAHLRELARIREI